MHQICPSISDWFGPSLPGTSSPREQVDRQHCSAHTHTHTHTHKIIKSSSIRPHQAYCKLNRTTKIRGRLVVLYRILHLIGWRELHSAKRATVEAYIGGVQVREHLIGHCHSQGVMHRVLLKFKCACMGCRVQ